MSIRSCVTFVSICLMTDVAVVAMRGPHHPKDQRVVRRHVHYKPEPPEGGDHVKLTQDRQLIQDEDHIREDMSGQVSPEALKNMTPEEMEFYYFKLHDFDNNSRLDGLELLKAIDHINSEKHHSHETNDVSADAASDAASDADPAKEKHERTAQEDLLYFTQLIDEVLLADDTDNDGFLSYAEYTVGKQRGLSSKSMEKVEPKALVAGQSSA